MAHPTPCDGAPAGRQAHGQRTQPAGCDTLPGMSADAPLTEPDYADLRRRLEGAVRRVCPPWLSDHADDLVQAAMMKIMRTIGEGNGELNTSFLYRVAHSVVVDEIRRVRRRREEAMTPSQPERISAPGAKGPESAAAGHQIGAAILDCVSHLHPDRRRAVTLNLQGHTVPETGRLLGFNDKKAENLVYRGLADLRECLRKKGVQP